MNLKFVFIIIFSMGRHFVPSQQSLRQDIDSYFTSLDLKKLEYLKDFVCGYSKNAKDKTKFDPFFCVRPEQCNRNSPPMETELSSCYEREPTYRKTTCCYIGNIKEGNHLAFNSDSKYWGLKLFPENKLIFDYNEALYKYHVYPEYQELLDSNKLCGLEPKLHTNKGGEDDKWYIPFFCREWDCGTDLSSEVLSWSRSNRSQPLYFSNGDQFCNTKAGQGYCCHPTSLMSEDFALKHFEKIPHFELKTMNYKLKAAVGFKSSFQCEQYSRLYCEDNYDRCSLRILNRDTAVPGEFPHQALLGVQRQSFRYFHCSGTLVSRYYILSTFLCKYHDRTPTSIALLGEYDTFDRREFGEREYFTYLDKVYVEPNFEKETYFSKRPYKISKRMKLLLFKMWRQVEFHFWVRPVCLNWKTQFKGGSDLTAVFPEETTFTGFGTTKLGGRWNRTLKRITTEPDSCEASSDACSKCKKAFFKQSSDSSTTSRPEWIPNDQFCLTPDASSTDQEDTGSFAPCQFDLGGSAVTMDPDHTPYCQWKVFGVNVDPREDCQSPGPALFRVIGGQLLAWLEDVIWHEDFTLPMFDLRWPSCADDSESPIFRNLTHLERDWIEYRLEEERTSPHKHRHKHGQN